MAVFQCDRCGCADNSAGGGTYNIRNRVESLFDGVKKGEKLCVVCTPATYKSGAPVKGAGEWHGRLERVFLPLGEFETNDQGNLVHNSSRMGWRDFVDTFPDLVTKS